MSSGLPLIFALQDTAEFGRALAHALDWPLAAHEERAFEDGEHKARPLESVEGADVYVVQSLHGGPVRSANDKLCRLLFFTGALKDAGAARVTVIAPYLCYARKDRRTKPSDPVTTRYVASMFEVMGANALITLEVHNPAAFENAFRIRAITLAAAPIFVAQPAPWGDGPFCVVSPDPGGVKRAEQFREALEARLGASVGKAFAEKHRSGGVVTGDLLVGDVAGATALVVDDLISTGGTLARAARAAKAAGAERVFALVAHGLFMEGSTEALADAAIERLFVTDAVPPFRLDERLRAKVTVLPCAPMFAEVIRRMRERRELSELLVY